MAKINQGILGGFSGKVGGVVGSSWKGIAVMKAKPLSVANPRTAGQVINRSKFSGVSQLGSQLLGSIVKPFWDKNAQQQSGFNVFVATNKNNYNDDGTPILGSIILSTGNIGVQGVAGYTYLAGDEFVRMDWDQEDLPNNALETDLVYGVVLDASNKVLGVFSDGVKSRGSDVVDVVISRPLIAGEKIGAYLFFKRIDGSAQSASSKIELTIA